MVSFNTRDLTLKALETLLAHAGDITMRVIVVDNASADGSADAIAQTFPQVDLVRSEENLGFARANNLAAEMVTSEWIVLLNPDTETHPGAIRNLVDFGRAHPQAGIVGGRTVFRDGSTNIASCWNRMTVWSLLCSVSGLTSMLPSSATFNPEGMGGWQRDSVRHADIIVGCLLAIPTRLWRKLDGFDPRYVMYGEDYDLCLRAADLGYRPMITPDAQIMHLVGAASATRADKLVSVYRSKATIIRDHWSGIAAPIGLALLWAKIALRKIAFPLKSALGKSDPRTQTWRDVWQHRRTILKGYPDV